MAPWMSSRHLGSSAAVLSPTPLLSYRSFFFRLDHTRHSSDSRVVKRTEDSCLGFPHCRSFGEYAGVDYFWNFRLIRLRQAGDLVKARLLALWHRFLNNFKLGKVGGSKSDGAVPGIVAAEAGDIARADLHRPYWRFPLRFDNFRGARVFHRRPQNGCLGLFFVWYYAWRRRFRIRSLRIICLLIVFAFIVGAVPVSAKANNWDFPVSPNNIYTGNKIVTEFCDMLRGSWENIVISNDAIIEWGLTPRKHIINMKFYCLINNSFFTNFVLRANQCLISSNWSNGSHTKKSCWVGRGIEPVSVFQCRSNCNRVILRPCSLIHNDKVIFWSWNGNYLQVFCWSVPAVFNY